MTPLETRVPNVVCAQAIDGPILARVVVQILAGYGRNDPDAVRDALQQAVERGDVERVEGGYRPGEWDEYQPAGAI